MFKLHYYETESTYAPYNLAMEEALMDTIRPGSPGCFLLWQNSPAVIIGRHQNALSEANLPELKRRGINLVRRMTGGGAVYHDLGNLNFSFILPQAEDREIKQLDLLNPIISYLKGQGVAAVMEGRNDLTISGQGKFSGLASRQVSGGYQLHGTIMYDVDLSILEHVLRVDPEKFKSKGVASVRARVTNLKPHLAIDLPTLWQGLREAYDLSPSPLEGEVKARAEKLAQEKYSRDVWNIGTSPASDLILKRRFSFGGLELRLGTNKNRIESAAVSGDFLTPSNTPDQIAVEKLGEALLGLAADRPEDWAQNWSVFDFNKVFYGRVDQEEIIQWLKTSLV